MMDYQITIQPSHEPVTLAEAKLHLRVDHVADDTLIAHLIAAARRWSEGYQARAWLRRTIVAKCDTFANAMELDLPPLISVSSVSYLDAEGAAQTLSTDVYDVDTTTEPGQIRLAYGQSWPIVRNQHHAVTITYLAGYVATFTADAGADTLTVQGGQYAVGDRVRLYTTTTLPAGLAADTDYYVKAVSGNAIQLSATLGGDLVEITDAGSGAHTIDAVPVQLRTGLLARLAELYMHRGDEDVAPSRMVRDLLGPERMRGF